MAPVTAASSQNVTLPVIPELYDPNFLDVLLPKRDGPSMTDVEMKEPEPSHPMIDALLATENRTRTTNNDPAYASTLSSALDLFQTLKPGCFDYSEYYRAHGYDIPSPALATKLEKAWKEDPKLTLRIIWNCRSIHDGKSDREAFYQAFGWLYENHPRTAIENLEMLVRPVCKIKGGECAPHGYWKDLLNIVALAAVGDLRPLNSPSSYLHSDIHDYDYSPRQYAEETKVKVKRSAEEVRQMNQQAQREARERRREKDVEAHHKLANLLADDVRFRALYIAVARLFAERLAADVSLVKKAEAMEPGPERSAVLRQVTLVGKWAPTPFASHDQVTRIATAISLLIFHSYSHVLTRPSISLSSDKQASLLDSHIIRSFYQRHVLTRLRKVIACPEPLMSSNRWSEIKYNRVPSVCMEQNLSNFFVHDPERFEQYLADVESGKKTISGATLLPHVLAKAAYAARREVSANKMLQKKADLVKRITEVKTRGIEAQWKVMMDRVREAGALDNCLAICDVSGSMGGFGNGKDVQPVEAAVALTLVVSSLAKPPFANKFITFSREPRFGHLDPTASLADKVKHLIDADAGFNTAFDKVFLDLLLPLAIEHKVKPEDMVKRLFVFTDMQFDDARQDLGWVDGKFVHQGPDVPAWETSHELIERKFKEAGYELPEIVYWNLRQGGGDTFPVTHDKQGVALMSGFSPSMLKVFMGEEADEEENWEAVESDLTTKEVKEKKKKLDPVSIMVKVVSKESYSGLVIVD